MAENPLIYVDLYQDGAGLLARVTGRAQRWRWRALNGNNSRVLAVSSESYTNQNDCITAIEELFANQSNVYLRASQRGNQLLRLATPPS